MWGGSRAKLHGFGWQCAPFHAPQELLKADLELTRGNSWCRKVGLLLCTLCPSHQYVQRGLLQDLALPGRNEGLSSLNGFCSCSWAVAVASPAPPPFSGSILLRPGLGSRADTMLSTVQPVPRLSSFCTCDFLSLSLHGPKPHPMSSPLGDLGGLRAESSGLICTCIPDQATCPSPAVS